MDEQEDVVDAKEYRRAMERSLTSLENCAAEMVSSLEKIRSTNHTIVGKFAVLDDIALSLNVLPELVKMITNVYEKIGEVDELRKRIVMLEGRGQR